VQTIDPSTFTRSADQVTFPNLGVWRLRTVADMDGDGVVDMLWQTGDGSNLAGGWYMNSNGTARDARYWWPTQVWEIKGAGK